MLNGDPRDGFFYPTLTLMIDSYKTDDVTATAGHLCCDKLLFYTKATSEGLGKPAQLCCIVKIIASGIHRGLM